MSVVHLLLVSIGTKTTTTKTLILKRHLTRADPIVGGPRCSTYHIVKYQVGPDVYISLMKAVAPILQFGELRFTQHTCLEYKNALAFRT